MRFFLLILILLPMFTYSCEQDAPVQVIWEFSKKPTVEKPAYLLILAPIKHEGMKVSGLSLIYGENKFSIQPYIDDKEHKGFAQYSLTVTKEFINNSEFKLSYVSDSAERENGTVKGLSCLHSQSVEVKI